MSRRRMRQHDDRQRQLRCLRQRVRPRRDLHRWSVHLPSRPGVLRRSVHSRSNGSEQLRVVRTRLRRGNALCRGTVRLPRRARPMRQRVRQSDDQRLELRWLQRSVRRRNDVPGRIVPVLQRDALRRHMPSHGERSQQLRSVRQCLSLEHARMLERLVHPHLWSDRRRSSAHELRQRMRRSDDRSAQLRNVRHTVRERRRLRRWHLQLRAR
jgi:hypothetical protein